MWFTGRLQRTGGLEAGGNDPQTVKNLSVGPFTHTTPHHTRPDQTRPESTGIAWDLRMSKGGFSSTGHTLAYDTSSCVPPILTKETEHTSS